MGRKVRVVQRLGGVAGSAACWVYDGAVHLVKNMSRGVLDIGFKRRLLDKELSFPSIEKSVGRLVSTLTQYVF